MLFLTISYVFSSTTLEDKWAEQVLSGREGGGAPNNVYTVSKCKNNKIK
jgi:hypothetical protein